MADFSTPPLFGTPVRWKPLEFLHKTYPTKTRGMGLPYSENFIILSSTVLYDSRTDGWAGPPYETTLILSPIRNNVLLKCNGVKTFWYFLRQWVTPPLDRLLIYLW